MTISAKPKVLKVGKNEDHTFSTPFIPFDINTMAQGYRFVQPKDVSKMEALEGVWMWNQNTTFIELSGVPFALMATFNIDISAFEAGRQNADISYQWLQSAVYEGYFICLIPEEEKPVDSPVELEPDENEREIVGTPVIPTSTRKTK